MAEGLGWISQQDFSGGAYPLQERMPPNAVEDLTNGLYDDDGSIYKRGGATYKTPSNIAITPLMIWDGGLGSGNRTLMGDASSIYMMDAGDTTVSAVATTGTPVASARPVVVSGMAFWPAASGSLNGWVMAGGSRQTTDQTGSGTVATGSTTIDYTGSGVLFGPQAQAGSVLTSAAVPGYAVPVAANDGSSKITLAVPWPGGGGSGISVARSFAVYHEDLKTNGVNPVYLASAAKRLWWMNGGLIRFTAIGKYATATDVLTNYHSLPSGEVIRGGKGIGSELMVFTNGGAWAVRNAAYDLTDAFGNPQQQLELVYPELRLWHINGVVSWKGHLIVPAIDDIYLADGATAPVPIGHGIRKQYRRYTAAGYTLGAATVTSGHYVLPVLNGTTWVDTLVCRLDTGAWGRIGGSSGASVGFANRVGSNAAEALLSIKAQRVLDCTGWFSPAAANKNDADGTTPSWQATLRTVQSHTAKDLLKKVRARVELDDAAADAPTVTAEIATGRPGSTFTSLTGSLAANDGQTPYTWPSVNVRATEYRVRLTSTSPSAKLVLRSVEYGIRARGRQ